MEFNALLEARRSVRAFDDTKAVTKEQIKTLIEAGIQAPSWKNSQTARYYCLLSDEARAKFSADCLPEFNAKSSHGAALVVTTFVSNRSGFDREGNPDNECGNGWGYYDLGLHNENFVLKAKELGKTAYIFHCKRSGRWRYRPSSLQVYWSYGFCLCGNPVCGTDCSWWFLFL